VASESLAPGRSAGREYIMETSRTGQAAASFSAEIVDAVWNTGDTDRLDEFVRRNYVRHEPSRDDPIRGIDGFAAFVKDTRRAMPDLHVTVERAFADDEGEFVLVEFTLTGTQTGVLDGIPPTGRRMTIHGATRMRIEDGKVREEYLYYDMEELRRQLGLTFPAILGNLPRFGRYYLGRLNERRAARS
jgi:steroid delta-isomerase-like uncharacterized protein